LALRLLGAVNRLVLAGEEQELERSPMPATTAPRWSWREA